MTRPYQKRYCGTLMEALDLCLELRKTGFWSFRGQRKEHWSLGLHHPQTSQWLDDHLREFKRRCLEVSYSPYIREEDSWRWLFFAQHHRLRTRLLDWTSNPLVAIYFAVENILSRADDVRDYGVVWALRVASEHFKRPEDLGSPESINEWLMINPPFITARLARQSGKFSFHPGEHLEDLDAISRRNGEEELIKICLRQKEANRNPAAGIRRQLGILNVHHAALFPDPEGIATFLDHEWGDIASAESISREIA